MQITAQIRQATAVGGRYIVYKAAALNMPVIGTVDDTPCVAANDTGFGFTCRGGYDASFNDYQYFEKGNEMTNIQIGDVVTIGQQSFEVVDHEKIMLARRLEAHHEHLKVVNRFYWLTISFAAFIFGSVLALI